MTKADVQEAQKWQWWEFSEMYLRSSFANVETAIKFVDHWLSDKTYLTGTQPTSIDVDIFRLIHKAVVGLSRQELERYPHLSRWFRLVQSTEPAQSGCPTVVISRTVLY